MATTLKDHGLTVIQSLTTPTRQGKAPRPVWIVEGMTSGFEPILYDLGGKKYHGRFSFWSDPSAALLEAIEAEGRLSFAERQERKVERAEERMAIYSDRAHATQDRANALYDKAHAMAEVIPLGQPVLIGHHSEGRDRRYRARIHGTFEKAFEEQDKAKHYKGKVFAASRTAAPKDIGFMNRRLEDAQTNLRDVERKLNGDRDWTVPQNAQWKVRLETLRGEYTEQVEYWQGQIEAAGGVQFTKETIKKGDYVFRTKSRDPFLVLRVNAKTVTGRSLQPNCEWFEPKIPYAEICKVITAEQYAAAQEAKA